METTGNSLINTPKPREEIEALNPYSAPLEGRRNLLRLDFNENTIGPSPLVMQALKAIKREEISIYPEYLGLKEKLVENLKTQNQNVNINSSEIGVFNGLRWPLAMDLTYLDGPNDSKLMSNWVLS